jgi:hypothetical protein
MLKKENISTALPAANLLYSNAQCDQKVQNVILMQVSFSLSLTIIITGKSFQGDRVWSSVAI